MSTYPCTLEIRLADLTWDHLVTLYMAERAPVAACHEHPGPLRFRRLVRIHSQEEGRITELEVFEGDPVAQGDLLVRLEDDLLRARPDKARATKQQKQLDLRCQEGLQSRRAVSEDDLAQARTALTVAQAEERLLETRYRASGRARGFCHQEQSPVDPGRSGIPGCRGLRLGADTAPARAGDPVELRIDALGPERFEGRILRIHPALVRTSRQTVVEVAMDPIPAGARAGQFVRATLGIGAVYRLSVPFRAVRRDREGEFLWLLGDGNKVERHPVRTGLRITDRIEITEGLEPGERVVTRGFLGLAEGKSVQVVAGSP